MTPEIRIATGTDAERRTEVELLALLATYDLTPWCFTTDVLIDEATRIPHSHPVLTLNTRNRGDYLLAGYVHEQLHWFCSDRRDVVQGLIIDELERRYPSVPVGYPDGCRSAYSTYLHVIVCWQELDALRRLLGRSEADQLGRRFAATGHYRWVYATTLEDFDDLADLYGPLGLQVRP
ncbi:hypothetical protein [Actinopolymorpha alba]|uniref:hypothetical protein n=1 Tax=Actinopolymorpha alba TaxID=533267 RepID=UPI000372B3CA|nr:hypothetical protein [Actinopolymorpha alba]